MPATIAVTSGPAASTSSQTRAPSLSVNAAPKPTYAGSRPVLGERAEEPLVAVQAGGEVLRTGDLGDPRVAELDQVRDREPHALAVVRGRRGQRVVLDAPVDQHDRGVEPRDLVEQLVVAPGGGGDEAVDLAGAHRLDVVALALRVVVGVGDQRRVARRAEPVVDAADIGGNSGF